MCLQWSNKYVLDDRNKICSQMLSDKTKIRKLEIPQIGEIWSAKLFSLLTCFIFRKKFEYSNGFFQLLVLELQHHQCRTQLFNFDHPNVNNNVMWNETIFPNIHEEHWKLNAFENKKKNSSHFVWWLWNLDFVYIRAWVQTSNENSNCKYI